MTLTRAQAESILIRRCGKLLTAAELDGTTVSGANADLNDPIASALRQCGLTVANIASVADSDLTALADSDIDKLLDLSELRTLESCLGNLDLVDVADGVLKESFGQLGARLERAIERKRTAITRTYGIGLGTLSSGLIDLGFQQQDACA